MSELLKPVKIAGDKKKIAETDNLWIACFTTLVDWMHNGNEPGAERWQADTRHKRPELINAIRDQWLGLMGDYFIWPWHDDFIVDVFVAMRKTKEHIKVAKCHELGLRVPQEWQSKVDKLEPQETHD